MKVPLIAKAIENGLSIVTNGEKKVVPFPFRPYVWSREIFATKYERKTGPYKCTELWRKEPVDLYKLEFGSPDEAYAFYKRNRDSQNVFSQYYDEQVMIEMPDFFLEHANTKPLKIMVLDIEVYTDGSGVFPNYKTNPIIAIGCGVDGEVTLFDNYSDIDKDESILTNFFNYFADVNPDIIVGYNHKSFDLPYIISRSRVLDLKDLNGRPMISYLSRYRTLPFQQKKKDEHPVIELHGRIMFDVLDFVNKDQSLFGIKNHKLSTLAEWYEIPYKDLDVINTSQYINTQEMKDYLTNDVLVTSKLFDIYFPLQQDLAELMQVPLECVVNKPASFVPKLLFGRNLLKKKFIPMQKNEDRYKDCRFQAAIVSLEKGGFFPRVVKIDFSSFYPNIVRTFNLGSDTTQICSMLPIEENYKVRRAGEHFWFNLPDKNFSKSVLIKVDATEDGFLKKEMNGLFAMRKEAKEKIKSDPTNEKQHKARSDSIKVIQNSLFGLAGLRHSYWGDMGTAIAIAGIARWIVLHLSEKLKGHIIEIDTDGLYIDCDVDINEINKEVKEFIHTHTKLPYDEISVEMEKEFDGPGYFYKQKNYVLLKKGGKLEKHGVSLKGSRVPRMYDRVIDDMAKGILEEKGDEYIENVIKGSRDLNTYELSEFVLRSRINKSEYVNDNALQPTLARRAKEVFNIDIKQGDAITYVKTVDGYRLSGEIKTTEKIDIKYYSLVVEKALAIFGHGYIVEKQKAKEEAEKNKKNQMELF